MPESESEALRSQDGDVGITFEAAKPVGPIEMKELESGPNDAPSSVLPIPDGSEPVKDHLSPRFLDKEINEEESLLQHEHHEQTEFLGGKLHFHGDIP